MEEQTVDSLPKRGRGRPPKNGSKKIVEKDERTIINDPLIEPYKIVVTSNSFNVVDSIRKEGAIADNPYAYCYSLDSALLKIVRLKSTKSKIYNSLKEYIKEYKNMIDELKEAIK